VREGAGENKTVQGNATLKMGSREPPSQGEKVWRLRGRQQDRQRSQHVGVRLTRGGNGIAPRTESQKGRISGGFHKKKFGY